MALINCPECTKEISDKVKACPHCGYPLIEETISEQIPQQVEVTAIKLKKQHSKKLKLFLIIFSVLVLLAISVFAFTSYTKATKAREARSTYIDNLTLISASMLLGASEAESLCNLTGSVWRNTIYEESDPSTDKFTKSNYGFNDDFNLSLAKLFADTSTTQTIDSIKSNQDLVSNIMKELKNPTPEFEKSYDTLSELYSSYQGLTDLAINPSGNLTSFLQSKSDKVDKFMEYYKKLETQIPEKESK